MLNRIKYIARDRFAIIKIFIASKLYRLAPFLERYNLKFPANDVSGYSILLSINATLNIDKRLNYFILYASYGDKWNILSYIGIHLNFYSNSRIIACDLDRSLISIFLEPNVIAQYFIFIDQLALNNLSSKFTSISKVSLPLANAYFAEGCKATVTSYFLEHGLPPGSIRHLHIIYYPYFNELYNLYGVSYGTLLKTLLYLPAAVMPEGPRFYTDKDVSQAIEISQTYAGSKTVRPPAILLNVVNFSQASLSIDQISLLIANLELHGFRVLLNSTQSPRAAELENMLTKHSESAVVNIPSRLLALVCDRVHAVIGVLGGAMDIAVQFSSAHVLSLQTPALWTGCSEEELLGNWGKEKRWEQIHLDWPCLRDDRVVRNVFVGDPEVLADHILEAHLNNFIDKCNLHNEL